MNDESPVTALAYYLPQFHRTPENDTWWGEGFTEWTTVRAATPLYQGHWQPRQPGELGWYDLADDDVRVRQAELARVAGLSGFMYWHYWFAGRRLLEMPVDRLHASSDPDFGFCLAWANESWTRVWSGQPRAVLVDQTYPGVEDHRAHYRSVRRLFADPRYVRVNGRPLFAIYRPWRIPDLDAFVETWASEATRSGEEVPYLVGELDVDFHRPWLRSNSALLDAVVDLSWDRAFGRLHRARKRLPRRRPIEVPYERVMERISVAVDGIECRQVPVVLTGWDNTPRHSTRGLITAGYTPASLEQAVGRACDRARTLPEGERLLVLKSWNEWSEGNYLEPDARHGRAWLEACRSGLQG